MGATEPLGDPIGCRGREKKASERGAEGGYSTAIGCEAAGGRAGGTQGLLDTSAILGASLMVSVSAFPAGAQLAAGHGHLQVMGCGGGGCSGERQRRGGRGGAARGVGGGALPPGSAAREGASLPPLLPLGIAHSAAGDARRPGSPGRPLPSLSAARSPAAGPEANFTPALTFAALRGGGGGGRGAPLPRAAPRRPFRRELRPAAGAAEVLRPRARSVSSGGAARPRLAKAIVGLASQGNKFCGFLFIRRGRRNSPNPARSI